MDARRLRLVHDSAPRERARADRQGLRWWKELLFVGCFYGVYTIIRDQFGSAAVGTVHALHNAERVIRLERWLGLFHEQQIQHWFLRVAVRSSALLNLYYGSAALRRADRRAGRAVPALARGLPAVAQHAGRHHRPGADRVQPLPAHAARACCATAPTAPGPASTTASSTRSCASAARGRSTRGP